MNTLHVRALKDRDTVKQLVTCESFSMITKYNQIYIKPFNHEKFKTFSWK